MKKLYVEELVVQAVLGDIKANTSWETSIQVGMTRKPSSGTH